MDLRVQQVRTTLIITWKKIGVIFKQPFDYIEGAEPIALFWKLVIPIKHVKYLNIKQVQSVNILKKLMCAIFNDGHVSFL